VDLVAGEVTTSPELGGEFGIPDGVELLDDGRSVALLPVGPVGASGLGELPGIVVDAIVLFSADLQGHEMIAAVVGDSPPALTRDDAGALYFTTHEKGIATLHRLVLLEEDEVEVEALFDIFGLDGEVRAMAIDAADLLYVATTHEVRRFELDGSAIDPGAPFFAPEEREQAIADLGIDAEGGIYVVLEDPSAIVIVSEVGEVVHVQGTTGIQGGFIRGDANGDTLVDEADVDIIFEYVFDPPPVDYPICEEALDIDDNDIISVRDAIVLLAFLNQGGPPPHAPFPACGSEPYPTFTCDLSTCPGEQEIRRVVTVGADPFGDPTLPSRFVAIEDGNIDAFAASAVVLTPILAEPTER
jgi:hypothetical protein